MHLLCSCHFPILLFFFFHSKYKTAWKKLFMHAPVICLFPCILALCLLLLCSVSGLLTPANDISLAPWTSGFREQLGGTRRGMKRKKRGEANVFLASLFLPGVEVGVHQWLHLLHDLCSLWGGPFLRGPVSHGAASAFWPWWHLLFCVPPVLE